VRTSRRASVPLGKTPYSVADGEVVPHYLRERDHVWLRNLLDAFQECAGRPRRDLEAHLRQCRFLREATARHHADLAVHVLLQLVGTRIDDRCLPPETRLELFTLAARMDPPDLALTEIGKRLGLMPGDVAQALFADLDEERLVQPVPEALNPGAVARAANLALAQALVRRATFAEVRVRQRSRAVVRMVKLLGLHCKVQEFSSAGGTVLEIRGVLAQLRTTTRYGHAIGRLLPLLPWCSAARTGFFNSVVDTEPVSAPSAPTTSTGDFQLRARCRLGNQDLWFRVRAGDPLPADPEPRPFDIKVEERFARDFCLAAPHLQLIREPEPIPVDSGFAFPDFRIQEPGSTDRSCLVEIIGYWTEDYLRKKVADLRSVSAAVEAGSRPGEPWILCVDQRRWHVEHNRPEHMQVVWYQRWIDPEQVLRAWQMATQAGPWKHGRPGCGNVHRFR